MTRRRRWAEQLADGLSRMHIALDETRLALLLDYLALMMKWNRAFNLTAINDPDQVVPRQILDSLSILHLLQGQCILDVGSGAGLPGIPLAIASPERCFTLLDSNGKKTRFLYQVKTELSLDNVEVVRIRAEVYHPSPRFDTVVSRAFAGMDKMMKLTSHLMAPGGCLLAMKGRVPEKEIKALKNEGADVDIVTLEVPWTEGSRHAIVHRPGTSE